MNNLLKRALGVIYAVQTATHIELRGVKVASLSIDILKLWGSKKVERYMFTNFDGKFISIENFFGPDLHYMIQQIHNSSVSQTSKSAIKSALRELEENTWMKRITGEFPDIIDREHVKGLFKKTPMPHQINFFEAFNSRLPRYGLNGYLLAAGPGSGKALSLNSKIKIPGGWARMGEMQVGTVVTAQDGTPSRVTGVYPQGELVMYKFSFADGRYVHACAEHLWKVYSNNRPPPRATRIATTLEVIDLLNRKERVHIDLCESEKGPDVELPIEPYLLGVILGDGCTTNGSISIEKADPEIFEMIKNYLPEDLRLVHPEGSIRYGISKIINNPTIPNSLTAELRKLNLMGKYSHQKSVPEIYKHASTQQRLAILQGLMDTDGTADLNGSASFCSTSIFLAKDVQYLVRSLGGIARISEKQTSYTYDGEKKLGRPAYNVNIRFKKPTQLFRLKRKQERVSDDHQYSNGLKLRVNSVEVSHTELAQCISIDHPDKLFITNDFIVTHNTYMSLVLAEMLKADLVVMVVPKNAVYRVWLGHLKDEYVKPQEAWVIADGQSYKGERFIISHFEALEKAKQVATGHSGLVMVILDESHNINNEDSLRTQTFVQMCKGLRHKYVLWASGTPIKALGSESIPLLTTIDPLFTDEVRGRFSKIFGSESSRALDILRNRLGMISFRVESSAVVSGTPHSHTQNIKISNGHQYTLEAIREEMSKFIDTRLKHYADNMKMYRRVYDDCLEAFQDRYVSTKEKKEQFAIYKKYVAIISKGFEPKLHANEARFCNHYEKNIIIPNLPDNLKKDFRNAKSVVKYPQLKVLGEALGGILGKKRVACQIDMIAGTDFKEIIDKADKKTIIFSSYVPVVDAIAKHLVGLGFKPVIVHAQADGSLPENVGRFEKDPHANPLVATFQSLSTAVPLTMANTTVFTNVPFRDHELVQAKARTNRLGQDTQVEYYFTYLDTGKTPNISTRSKDILEWSRAQIASILGQDYSGEITPELLPGMESLDEGSLQIVDELMEH